MFNTGETYFVAAPRIWKTSDIQMSLNGLDLPYKIYIFVLKLNMYKCFSRVKIVNITEHYMCLDY